MIEKFVPPTRYKALVIDPELDSRMRLKQAAQAVHQIQSVHLSATLSDAMRQLQEGGGVYDVIFASERLDKQEAVNFTKEARQQAASQDAAFVLLLAAKGGGDSARAARSVLSGYDGCLMEPYSVDSLLEITELASRVKKERYEARTKAAIEYILREVVKTVDRLAYIRSCGMDPGVTLRRLREACNLFEGFG